MKKIKRLLCILCVLSMITSLPVVAADITYFIYAGIKF